MGVLERGGNAFDAGVATAFTLQVVEPHLNGPLGDVPIIVHDKRRGRTEVICGQGPAPEAATIAHYRGLGLDMVPGTGLLAAVVPGTFDALMLLLRDYGTLRPRDVLEAAIGYAGGGYPLVERIPATIQTVEAMFREHWRSSAAIYLPGGEVPRPGSLFTNPAMAATYARVLAEAEAGGGGREAEIERARRCWQQGFVAEAIDRFCRTEEVMDTSGRAHRGGAHRRGHGAMAGRDRGRRSRSNTVGTRSRRPGSGRRGRQPCSSSRSFAASTSTGSTPPGRTSSISRLRRRSSLSRIATRSTATRISSASRARRCCRRAYNAERRALIGERASLDYRPGTIPGYGKSIGPRVGGERTAVGATGAGEPTVGRIASAPGSAPTGGFPPARAHGRGLGRHGPFSTSSTETATW